MLVTKRTPTHDNAFADYVSQLPAKILPVDLFLNLNMP